MVDGMCACPRVCPHVCPHVVSLCYVCVLVLCVCEDCRMCLGSWKVHNSGNEQI